MTNPSPSVFRISSLPLQIFGCQIRCDGRELKMKTSIKVSIAGAVLFVGGFVLGFGVTVLVMVQAFNTIDNSSGTPVPSEQVTETVRYAFMVTSIGIGVSFLGLCLGLGGLIAYLVGRKRRDA
jgi:hypothetical protein